MSSPIFATHMQMRIWLRIYRYRHIHAHTDTQANPALGSISWGCTRTLEDSPRNSLTSSISNSKNMGFESSIILSATFFAWNFIIIFDTFFLAAFCWGSTVPVSAKACQLRQKPQLLWKIWRTGLDVVQKWMEQELYGRASCWRGGLCVRRRWPWQQSCSTLGTPRGVNTPHLPKPKQQHNNPPSNQHSTLGEAVPV